MPRPSRRHGHKVGAGGVSAPPVGADASGTKKRLAAGAKGARFERQVRGYLRAQGYGVTRSTGSLGVADLWAAMGKYLGTELLIVECRSGREQLRSDSDRHDLLALAGQTGGIPLLACKEQGKPGGIRFRRILASGYEEYSV